MAAVRLSGPFHAVSAHQNSVCMLKLARSQPAAIAGLL